MRRYFNKASFGFAAFLAVNAFTIWGGTVPFIPTSIQAEPRLLGVSSFMSIMFWGFLLGAGLSVLRNRFFQGRFAVLFSGICTLSGVIILAAAAIFSLDSLLPYYVAVALTGLGSAGFFLSWECYLASLEIEKARYTLAAGSALSPFVYAIVYFLPTPLSSLGVIVLIIISLVALWVSGRDRFERAAARAAVPQNESNVTVYKQVFLSFWRPMLALASLGFVAGAVRSLAFENSDAGIAINGISFIGVLASALGLLLYWKFGKRELRFSRFYEGVFPFVATGFLALPFFDWNYTVLFAGFVYFLFSVASILMMLSSIKIANTGKVSPLFTYGIYAGSVYCLMSLGSSIGTLQQIFSSFGIAQISVLSLFCVWLLAVALLFLRKRNTRHPSADEISTEERVLLTEQLRQRTEQLARTQGLSARETEVMQLVACGRDVKHIASQLFVSENTIRTHNKNIYRKLGIHSRQELLDLLDKNVNDVAV